MIILCCCCCCIDSAKDWCSENVDTSLGIIRTTAQLEEIVDLMTQHEAGKTWISLNDINTELDWVWHTTWDTDVMYFGEKITGKTTTRKSTRKTTRQINTINQTRNKTTKLEAITIKKKMEKNTK